MTIIIGITGKAGAGKDTAAAALVRELGYVRIGLADGVKEAVTRHYYISLHTDKPTKENQVGKEKPYVPGKVVTFDPPTSSTVTDIWVGPETPDENTP